MIYINLLKSIQAQIIKFYNSYVRALLGSLSPASGRGRVLGVRSEPGRPDTSLESEEISSILESVPPTLEKA